jgi:KUP system potassium uptake protein
MTTMAGTLRPQLDGPGDPAPAHAKASFWTLMIGSMGVVHSGIGTSPLHALKESLTAAAGTGAPTPEMVAGVVSVVFPDIPRAGLELGTQVEL